MTIVDITTLSGEDLRHFAYLADRRAERAEERRAEMLGSRTSYSSSGVGPHSDLLGAEKIQFKGLGTGKAWQDALSKQEAQHLAHPEQLAVIVWQIAEWTDDVKLIAQAAVLHAEKCGIPREVFVPIITDSLCEVIHRGR